MKRDVYSIKREYIHWWLRIYAVWGLISAVKNYEQLAVEAAVTGDKNIALLALLAHPLVRDYDVAAPLLDELLEANKEYLPQFFGKHK